MRGDEARIIHAFTSWLAEQGWDGIRTEVRWCDVIATRDGVTLYGEAKGRTEAVGLDVDTLYGQLLRRMSEQPGPDTRYAVVVPAGKGKTAALRVPVHIRELLQIDVYSVAEDGTVEAFPSTAPETTRLIRKQPLWNKRAFERSELLSPEHAPDVLAARRAKIYDGQIGRLNRWVDTVRASTGEDVPYFDPASAGRGPRVLLLLQDPSGEASAGSGIISRHNNDPTAANLNLAAEAAGLSYENSLHWNVIPWWVGNPAKEARTLRAEATRARPYLSQLLHLLSTPPSAVVLVGGQAQAAWQALTVTELPDGLGGAAVLSCPHTSPLAFPRTDRTTGRRNSEIVIDVLRQAATIAQ